MTTLSEENYLKAIYHLGNQGNDTVSTNAISEQIDTKASSVTDMVKKLAEKELANYIKYQGVSLTEAGRLTARSVIRKHRLWEVFLVEKLGYNWDEVHEIAEQLEHIESETLINKLDSFLDFPKIDPHGDPIPSQEGEIPELGYLHLSEVKLNETCTLMGVAKDSAVFLQLLTKLNLSLGARLEVLEINTFDRSVSLKIAEQEPIFISHEVAKNILVKV